MPNLVLLDMNMPGMDGLETCRAIRNGSDIPVIILSVRNTEKDKVAALDAGRTITLRSHSDRGTAGADSCGAAAVAHVAEGGPRAFHSPGLEIDFETRRVHANGKDVRLTPKEFDLFRYLVSNAGKPVPHRELLRRFGARTTGMSRSIYGCLSIR